MPKKTKPESVHRIPVQSTPLFEELRDLATELDMTWEEAAAYFLQAAREKKARENGNRRTSEGGS